MFWRQPHKSLWIGKSFTRHHIPCLDQSSTKPTWVITCMCVYSVVLLWHQVTEYTRPQFLSYVCISAICYFDFEFNFLCLIYVYRTDALDSKQCHRAVGILVQSCCCCTAVGMFPSRSSRFYLPVHTLTQTHMYMSVTYTNGISERCQHTAFATCSLFTVKTYVCGGLG